MSYLWNHLKICEINAKREINAQRGQALLELAIFGMVALVALGFLVRLGMQMNFDQETRMGAFRRALAAARADDGTPQDAMAVGYYYVSDRQMPNPSDGFQSLPRNRSEASAFVEVGNRLTFAFEDHNNPNALDGRKTQPRFVVRVNGAEKSFRQNDFADPSAGALPGLVSLSGITTKSQVTNSSCATLGQNQSGSSLNSGTSTCLNPGTSTSSTTWVNTKSGEVPVSGGASGGGHWPP